MANAGGRYYYTPWIETYVFLPKRTINGKRCRGKIYLRERKVRLPPRMYSSNGISDGSGYRTVEIEYLDEKGYFEYKLKKGEDNV